MSNLQGAERKLGPTNGAHLRFFRWAETAGIPAGDSEAEGAAKMAALLAEREGART